MLVAQSGGIFEATRFAALCEVSRTTISNYLKVLEATFVAHVVRPFSIHRPTEIVAAPKVFAFDTGFVCYFREWYELRAEDLGTLWEHLVLNEMQANLQTREVNYWRDKRGTKWTLSTSGVGSSRTQSNANGPQMSLSREIYRLSGDSTLRGTTGL